MTPDGKLGFYHRHKVLIVDHEINNECVFLRSHKVLIFQKTLNLSVKVKLK